MFNQNGKKETENPDGFMCHICNVFVYGRFAKDHSNSKKHQSYKKLTKNIVQNFIKQQNVSINYNNNERNELPDNFTYCGPCSKPIPPADKLKHRISKDHLKAVENETIFNNFIEMYFDTHPNKTEFEDNETIVDLDKILAVKGLDEIDCVTPTNSMEQRNLLQNVETNKNNETPPSNANQSTLCLTKSPKEVEVNNNNETIPTNGTQSTSCLKVNESEKKNKDPNIKGIFEKEIMELKQYINDITEQYDVKLKAQFKVDDSLSVIARAPNGNKKKITVDAFHSYTYGVNFVNCQLCKLLIDPEAKAKHSATLKHMKYVSVPINNEFCREVNSAWCHDVVRNEMALIEEKLTPMTFIESTNNTANTTKVIENGKDLNKNKNIKYCDVCDLQIHINNFVEHVKGKKHILNEKKINKMTPKVEIENQGENIKIELDKVTIKMEPISTYHETEKLKDITTNTMDISQFLQYLQDMVANFNLNYKLPAVENNCVIMITPRGYKVNVTMDTFHSYKQVETGLYCQVCQLQLSGNVNEHSMSRTHVRNITLPVDDNFARRINKAWSHCLICNLMVLAGYQHAMTNPAHKNHNPIHESKTTAVHNNLDENLMEYCDDCDRNMLKRDFTAHVSGKQHIKNFNNKALTKKTTTTNEKMPISSQKEITTRESDFETYLKEMTVKYKLDCKLPSVKDNGVIIVTPSGCTEKFAVNTFHSYKHADGVIFCQMCQLWIRNDVNVHSVDKTHVSLIMQPVDDNFTRLINRSWSHCLVCNIMILNDNHHVSTSPSHNKYKKLTKAKPTQQPQNIGNQVKKPEDKAKMTYCDACKKNIDTHNFISHTAGRKHKDNETNANKKGQIKQVNNNTLDGISNTKKYADNTSNVVTKTGNVGKVNDINYVNVNPNNTKIEAVQANIPKSNINLDSNVNTKCMMIIAPNGCDAMATEDGFHSYKRIRSFIYCQVCSKWMSQEDAAHIVSKCHMKHIMQPIDNEFIRQVNPTWQHCLICNEMIPTDTTHEHTPELTNQDVITANYTKIRKTMCYPCFEYIHTCSFSAHIQTQKHITKLRKSNEKNKNNNNKSTPQVVTAENEASSNTIFNDIANFELYFKTIKTKYDLKLSTPIVENNSILIQTPKGYKESIDIDSFHSYKRTQMTIFCQICQVSVSEDEYEHSVTDTHARHVAKPVDDNFARTINQAWRHCVLCNEMIFTGFDHVTNNSKHDKFTKPSTFRNYNNNITSNQGQTHHSNNNSKVTEDTMQVAPSIRNIDASNANLRKNEENFRQDLNKVDISLNDISSVKNHNDPIKEDMHLLLNNNKIKKTSSGIFHCRLCCIDVKDFLIHINENLEHIKAKILDEGVKKSELIRYVYNKEALEDTVSTAYKQIYEDLLLENKIKKLSKLVFSCGACTTWFTCGNEINHMFSDEHKYFLELNK